MISDYSEGDVDGSGDLGNFGYDLLHATLGQDFMRSESGVLGAYLSIGRQEMDEHDSVIQSFDGNVYHVGLYADSTIKDWDISALAGYAYGDHDSQRQGTLGSLTDNLSADFKSHSFYTGLRASIIGYQNDWVSLAPEAGMHYVYYRQESFKESCDQSLALEVDSADAQAIVASAGVNARFKNLLAENSLYPLAFVRYEHDFYANSNNEHEIDAALVSTPGFKESFVGQNRGENIIKTGVGLASDVTEALQINGGVVHTWDSHGDEWGARFELSYRF